MEQLRLAGGESLWGRRRRLLLLLLLCSCRGALAAWDYDDYSANETEDSQPPPQNGLCPRAIPARRVSDGNTTFLRLPEASRAQLGSQLTVLLLPSFYTLVFLVGLPANALALWVLATRVEKLPSTVFLINLAAADLLLGLLLPLKISYYFLGNHWPFGEAACRLTTAAFYGNMYCSLLLLACISVDRYLAVAHPFFARSCRSPAFAAGTCAGAWLAAALATLPLTLLRQSFPLEGSRQVLCHDALPQEEDARHYRPYFAALASCGFLLPLLVMLLSCGATLRVLLGSGKRYATAVKLTALVLLSAVAFFAPSNVLLLLHYGQPCSGRRASLYLAYMGSLALSAANSCLDPFVYYYVSADFREKVRGRLFGPGKGSAVSLKTSKETLPPARSCRSESLV
ncbi:proteinase-activated receptor 4 [Hemicordylus capensis]|uniref:proteinase-activated receptor 4 n=1 Tax=Hemicordylus capensis TaxID=884348 RepID=UPI0023044B3C|nr:proteinase-activated receptor 4 [Hemicordylus capensis]